MSMTEMFDPFGMTAFGGLPLTPTCAATSHQHQHLVNTANNGGDVFTPRQNSRLYQNISASFYPVEHSDVKASVVKSSGSEPALSDLKSPTQFNRHSHGSSMTQFPFYNGEWLNDSDTLQQMEQTLTSQIEEYQKNLRCLDSIPNSPGLHELRRSMLAQLTKLQSILQSILHQRIVMSPSVEQRTTCNSINIIPVKSTKKSAKVMVQDELHRSSTETRNLQVALMPIPQQQTSSTMNHQQQMSARQKLVAQNHQLLKDCTWYHGKLTWQEADHALNRMPCGTFLLRDSQSGNCEYSLSVKHTDYGPTSIRINFTEGKFRLDSDGFVKMPGFNSIPDLVMFYYSSHHNNKQGVTSSQAMQAENPITLVKPLHKNTPKLTHLARLAINTLLHRQTTNTASDHLHPTTGDLLHLENDIVPRSCQRIRSTAVGLNIPVKLADYLETYKFMI